MPPISSNAPRPLGAAYVPILLSEVEQEQRPSGNGDREAIVVGAGLRDGEGERAYTVYDPILGGENGFRTFRHKTFRQQDGGRRFGNFLLPKRLWCRNVFTAGERRFGKKFSVLSPSNVGAYSVYARSPSPSQRPAPTTIASRSPFPLGLCSCSTSLSQMGI